MTYKKWIQEVPKDIKEDAVWSLKAYNIALFMADLSWIDIKPIINQKLFSLSDQLYRATGSISANITEGYSRKSLKEQARFYEIALGSAREAKDWYFKSRHILGKEIANHRIKILTKIIKLLLTMINERRKNHSVQETNIDYQNNDFNTLLTNIPTAENTNNQLRITHHRPL
jgi:four helix bundle protein